MPPRTAHLVALGCVLLASAGPLAAQLVLPPGAVAIVNEDRVGDRVALCADTDKPSIQQGPRTIRSTAVWAGNGQTFHQLKAGPGACDPAWSPDGRRLALTAADGLWVFAADTLEGELRVEAKLPLGWSSEFHYRAFAHPRWSPDGLLVGLIVTNGGTSWVEVFEARTGRLYYTSPPETYSFSWGGTSRELKLGDTEIRFPAR